MRKSLFPLLCFSLIFSSCQENNPDPPVAPTSSSSSVCGTASLTVGGTNYTLNNPLMNAGGTCSNVGMVGASLLLSFQNMYPNNWDHEWVLNLQANIPTPIGTTASDDPGFHAQLTLGSNTNNPTTVLYHSYLSTTWTWPGSGITITYIDSTNNTIDGNFSCTVYHAYTIRDSTNFNEDLLNHTSIPPAMDDHYVVYVDDIVNPSEIVGYHDNINDTWYNANGIEIPWEGALAQAADGWLNPYLATNSTPQLINVSFSDIPFIQ